MQSDPSATGGAYQLVYYLSGVGAGSYAADRLLGGAFGFGLFHPPGAPTEDERVKQVWFEGAHSDVGGGYRETGLSDTSLLWMAREAHDAGLVFDVPLLTHYVSSGSDPVRHNPLNGMYKVDNLFLGARMKVGRKKRASAFSGGLRRLTNERALSVRVASSAVAHFQEGGYEPANLQALADATNGFEDLVEPVIALPESGVDLVALGSPSVAADPGD